MTTLLMDISSHGVAEAHGARGRTGIFRVVDEVAGAMAVRKELDVRFCAVRRPVNAARYAAMDARLSQRPFLTGRFQRLASRRPWLGALAGLERALDPVSLAPTQPGEKVVFWSGHYHFLAARPSRFQRRFVTVHDLLTLEHPEWFPSREISVLTAAARRIRSEDWDVIFDTHHVRSKASEILGIPLEKSHVIAPGLDHDLFRYIPTVDSSMFARCGLAPGDPYALTLCTLEPRKGLGTAIRAFTRASASGWLPANAKLVLAGSPGWGMADLDAALSEAGEYASRVLLTGFIEDRELPALYSNASCFLFPSLAEGFGFPPLEAMACGCPVIASAASCLPEVLGKAAILLPPTDIEAWARAIGEGFQDSSRDLRRELGFAQAHRYRWSDTVENLKSLLFQA